MPKKLTTEEFVEKAVVVHGDEYDYSKSTYIHSHKALIVICKEHGEFSISPTRHIYKKQKCPGCSSKNLTTKEFIKKAKLVHGDKYDYSKSNYINCYNKVVVICKEHGEFKINPNSHVSNKTNCPKCSKIRRTKTKKLFIEEAKTIHGDKYDYSKVIYTNSITKVILVCKEHGEFKMTPNQHVFCRSECPMCHPKVRTTEEFVKKAISVHGKKYDYSNTRYINSYTKVEIFCNAHNGYFTQKPSDHINTGGCEYCGKIEVGKKLAMSKEEFVRRAKLIHKNQYNYDNVIYVNSKTKVKIFCNKHKFVFEKTPAVHVNGVSGCPKCGDSNGEKEVGRILEINGLFFEKQKKFIDCKYKNQLPFDFYLPRFNTCIEFDGVQHFIPIEFWGGEEGFKKIIIRDQIKNDYCGKNNIRLLRIKYNENIEEKLNFLFNELIVTNNSCS